MKFVLNLFRFVGVINERVARVVRWVIVLIMCLIFLEVILRYVFNSPTIWAGEVCTYLFGFFSLMAGGYILLIDKHVRIDILYRNSPPRARAIMESVNLCLVLLFVGLFLWKGWTSAYKGMLSGETSFSVWAPPYWPYKFVLPIGCFLVLWQAAANLVVNLRYIISGKEGEGL